MDLQNAIEQYADMVSLGSGAVQRLVEQQLVCPQRAELIELLTKLMDIAEQLKTLC